MANDQYTVPEIPGERQLQEARQVAESIQRTPERQDGMFDRLKQTEERIYNYRRTSLAIEEKSRQNIVLRAFERLFGVNKPKVTLKSLIESESYIGGKAFGPHNRMWLSHKGSSALSHSNQIGDWYHVREIYDSYGRKVGEPTLHFETHPMHINKLHNGKPTALSIAELETFVHAVELYEQNVREELYPFDQEIFDLLTEMDQDNIVIPDSVEEKFGKEIVARVLAAYKAQKSIDSVTIPDTVEDMFGAEAVKKITDDVRVKQ